MGVAWPAALLGLIALTIPLLIHLLARGEFQRVAVATTRFVRERPRLRWRRLQISRPLLLALRMALVVLCVLLIAEPFRHVAPDSNRDDKWTLVSTRLDAAQARALIDDPGATPRWLAPGFPPLDQPRPVWRAGQLWSLLDAADHLAPGALSFDVVVPSDIARPGAHRLTLARAVRWIDAGSVTSSDATATTLNIDIVYDPLQRREADAIATAVAAWQDAGLSATARTIPAATATLSTRFVVWLSAAPFPSSDDAPRVVVARRALLNSAVVATDYSADGSVAVREQHAGGVDVRVLDNLFTADGTPNGRLARDLLNAFLGPRLTTPPNDYPVTTAQLTSTSATLAQVDTPVRQPLTTLFTWLIALVAAIERVASAVAMRLTHDA